MIPQKLVFVTSYPVSFGSHYSHEASWSTGALKLLSG